MSGIDPVVLFFLLGVLAGALRSDLRLPGAIYEFVSIVLLLSIGLKGGIELARQPAEGLAVDIVAVVAMGFVLPLLAYPVLRWVGRLPRPDAASIAAHYGSVSVGTFAVAVAYCARLGIDYEKYAPLFVVLLEVPAILVGIVIAKGLSRDTHWGRLSHELFLGKSIVLLLGGLAIGWIAGPEGIVPLDALFFDLFKGILAIFLLEMGLIAARHLSDVLRHGVFLVAFGLVAPLAFAGIGSALGHALGLSTGGVLLLATLAGSASYIAAPAAMRTAVPEANPALSLTASLAIKFTFNILVGIPLYHRLALWWTQGP
ncbi:MAG: sodium-dependent bicarbonate transport family permease [Pseudomonadota bacterium]